MGTSRSFLRVALCLLAVVLAVPAPQAAALAVQAGAGPRSAWIDQIEINQAIGQQLDGHLYYVAGKDTVVRALLSQAVVVGPQQTSALIRRDGSDVATLAPIAYKAPTATALP